ncbi:MAG: hypothetical protein J5504_06450 [Butyrivibrio sp.]|nr:hypothetical protein [Butyrivibrio sp.]
MKMQRMKTTAFLIGICMAAMLIVNPVIVMAGDTVMLPLEVYGKDVVSVALPSVSEDGDSPFDFIIDPQELIFATDAAKYGGGKVEGGATLLFRNHDGEFDFSRRSDRLTVKNQSNVPVVVTITASIDDLGDIDVVGSPDFGDSDACSMYLAVVDDEGNEKPISEEGEISVSTEMREAPEDAYVYRIDEENGSYSYEFSRSPEEIDFDSYSFGLTGYCNPNGNWQDISIHPIVRITWKVEPLLSEEEIEQQEESEEEAATEGDSEQTEEHETAKEPESDVNESGQETSETTDKNSDSASTEVSVVEKRPVLGEQVSTEQPNSNASVAASVEVQPDNHNDDHEEEQAATQETSNSVSSSESGDNAAESASDDQNNG